MMNPNWNELKKARILERISECEQNMNEGGKDDLQLHALFSASMYIITKPNFLIFNIYLILSYKAAIWTAHTMLLLNPRSINKIKKHT